MATPTTSSDRIAQDDEEEANNGVENNQPRERTLTGLDPSQSLIKTRNWWICIFVCSSLVVTGRSLSALLLNFYFVQTGRDVCEDPKQFKGTWFLSIVQNAAFPSSAFLLLLWRSLFSSQSVQTLSSFSSSSSSYFGKLFLLYIILGVLFAAYSQLYAIGRTHCMFFSWIFTTQLIFTTMFTKIINEQKFNRWIILSLLLSGAATGLSITFSGDATYPCESEGSRMSNGAWCAFFGTIAFSLSLCLMQYGFQMVITNTESRVSRVLVMQTNASMIATLICFVGLFVSGEFKDIKEDLESFKKGKALYVLSLMGLSVAWQVMYLGLVGLVCLASSLFANVVSFCATPLVNILVVLAFRFMDDYDVQCFKGGALLAGILGFASYVYSLYKSTTKEKITS